MTTQNDERDRLSQALRDVANDDATMGVSPQVEARLRAEVKLMRLADRRRRNTIWLSVAASLAVVALALWAFVRASVVPGEPTPTGLTLVSISEVKTDFMPLPYSSVPTPSVRMVRLEVPRQALASFGLASLEAVSDSETATVTADVLVGDDGLARAVRFVRPIGRRE
jgi:hypothetical protein